MAALVPGAAPQTSVMVRLAAGARVSVEVEGGAPEEPSWQALRTWWREAFAQSVAFSVAVKPAPDLPRVVLSLSDDRRALTATLVRAGASTQLAAATIEDARRTADLHAAIDQLAWSARAALGESAARPLPVAQITSPDPRVVVAVTDAAELVRTGAFGSAYRALRKARRRDGGAPYVLAPLAAAELLRGDPTRARDISREAVNYPARCSPTVQHRLARTLLMANAALEPARTERYDRELQRLATVARRERPHDDEVLFTAALAHNFRAEFEQAKPLLEELHRRLPERGLVSYHLGWACLGTDDAEAAAAHLRDASRRLPTPWLILPWAIALFEAQQDEELERVLTAARADYGRGGLDALNHQVLRIQAAHALLRDDPARARALLVEDLHWLVTHPVELDLRAGDFAEAGAVLVRLGGSKELGALVAAVQKLPVEVATRDAASFVGGLHQVQTTGVRARSLEEALSRDGDSAWGALLAAYAHEQQGEVGAMQAELARAALLSSSAMTKALLARSLRAVGKAAEGERLSETLTREMLTLNLRGRCQHPLFGPELAYAYLLR